MKRITLLLFCLLSILTSYAQQKAVTEMGEEVILFEDGTWEYQNENDIKETVIPTNPKEFVKDEKSTFLFKSSKLNIGFWLDPKLWSFNKSTENADAEYEFQLKNSDLYGMVITEKIEVPLETLRTLALDNGREHAPDLRIVKEEYRNVNGLKVLMLQMNGTMQGIKFSYYGYYFSSANGSAQFITYTSQNLLEGFILECEKMLNGLVEIN